MKVIITILCLLTCAISDAQVNIVLNPDFEVHSQCPDQWDQIKFADYWSPVDSTLNSICNPEYCNSCSQNLPGYASIPDNVRFYQYARSGDGLALVQMFFDEYMPDPDHYSRDYLQGRLRQTPESGKSYCVSFYVSLADGSGYATDHIGAYLDNGSIDTVHDCGLPLSQYLPQVLSQGVISDTQHWTKIEGSYIAQGNERFITIGNFADKAHTNFIGVPNQFGSHYTWYLVDDVSVIESDLPAYAGEDRAITAGDSTFIGRPPEVGLECLWRTIAGDSVGAGSGIWVQPVQTTGYVVAQTLCGVTRYDTVTVYVWNVGVSNVVNATMWWNVDPNPAHDVININAGIEDNEKVLLRLFDVSGREVMREELRFTNNNAEVKLKLAAGVYVLELEDAYGMRCRKKVVLE